jgi:RimJ/RimL family protein N-acetyltransferase
MTHRQKPIRIRVSETHYMRHHFHDDKRSPFEAREFFVRWCGTTSHADAVVVATQRRRVVGCLRYTVIGPDVLREKGVWVDANYQRRGLGQRLLDTAMQHTGATTVLVTPVTHDGQAWMRRAAKRYHVINAARNPL